MTAERAPQANIANRHCVFCCSIIIRSCACIHSAEVSLYAAKVWIIAASARFCPDTTLVSLPTWLLGAKSRSARQIARQGAVAADKVSICMWACLPTMPTVGMGWVAPSVPIGCLPSWAWVPAAVLPSRPCLSFFFPPEYKFISSPVELQSDLGGQRSSFQEVSSPAASTLLPVQLINSGTDFGDAMRLLVVFFTQITYNILQMRCMLCWISYSDFCQEAFGLLLLLSLALTAPVPAPQNGRQVSMKWTFDSVTSFDMLHPC